MRILDNKTGLKNVFWWENNGMREIWAEASAQKEDTAIFVWKKTEKDGTATS
jgi:hypothetical protein